jgi:CRP-like cAMP-binding protein
VSWELTVERTVKLSLREREAALKSALLADLDPRLQRHILDGATGASYRAREVIIAAQSELDHFFAILTGHIRLYRIDQRGREADIAIYGPGDVFGECAMFLDGCYPFQVQAAETTTLAVFNNLRIKNLLRDEPDLAMAVGRIIAQHSTDARLNIASDRINTAPQRVALYLLQTWREQGATDSAFKLPFQKSLLAGKLGLAPEALSRAFAMLQRAGVTIRGRMVHISDAEALENF